MHCHRNKDNPTSTSHTEHCTIFISCAVAGPAHLELPLEIDELSFEIETPSWKGAEPNETHCPEVAGPGDLKFKSNVALATSVYRRGSDMFEVTMLPSIFTPPDITAS